MSIDTKKESPVFLTKKSSKQSASLQKMSKILKICKKFDHFTFKLVNDKGAGLGLFLLACNKVRLSCVKTQLEQFASEQGNQLNALQ